MTTYTVRFEAAVEADSLESAARQIHLDYFDTAATFLVQESEPQAARWDVVEIEPFSTEKGHAVWDWTPHQDLALMAKKLKEDGGDIDTVISMLEKPWNWSDLLASAKLDAEYDKVSPVAEEPDLSTDIPEGDEDE